MSEQQESRSRPVGGTEQSWCKAIPGGTGITVLGLLLSKPPNLPIFENAIHILQTRHPIIRSHFLPNPTTNSFSLITPPHFTLLRPSSDPPHPSATIHSLVEHELNQNPWREQDAELGQPVFFSTVYGLTDATWVVVLRLHTAACDRTAAAEVLREMLEIVGSNLGIEEKNGVSLGIEEKNGVSLGLEENNGVVGLGIEEYVPHGKRKKAFWARGVDMLGYSLNSFRLSNLEFVDAESPRSSQFVRLKLDLESTNRLLSVCKLRGIGLCGALSAAGLIAARLSKSLPHEQWEKYAVVTLIDCRSILEPVVTIQHLGFYHSAILNTHDIRGGENFWELAERTYRAFSKAKNNNKHFSDMSDLNFLMCKAIENPGLTPSSSMRTSFISVFEDPMIDHTNENHQKIGLKDYTGCASAHGVGPTIAIFDTIRDGELDCACVYPSPLHSREQMEKLVSDMKIILVDSCSSVESDS